MDGITLDHLIAEARLVCAGRHVRRVRVASPHAVVLELAGDRSQRLRLDAGRGMAGLYLLPGHRSVGPRGEASDALLPGRTRQALLHLRKHVEGSRISGLTRVPGERTLVLDAGAAQLVLRVHGAAPALTLAVNGAPLATVGDGAAAWPAPAPSPEREWDRVDPAVVAEAVARAVSAGRSVARGVLAACPMLGPLLAAETDGTPRSLAALRERLSRAEPTLLAPGPLDACDDAELAGPDAVALAPIRLERRGRVALRCDSWVEAAAVFLDARLRGDRFDAERRRILDAARREWRRLDRLAAHLSQDVQGLPDAGVLRRQAEALLAAPACAVPGASEAVVPDPYDPTLRLQVALDPALSAPANADRLFERARRVERARGQIEARRAGTRVALEQARGLEARALAARNLRDLEAPGALVARGDPARPGSDGGTGPRHYLTSRGLSLLVGRGAKENHRLTFGLARPEDLWLHARGVPGGHVILRDNEGRAVADDIREAAEVAAFFSASRAEASADVQVTRRKHVRPAGGGPGRVSVAHADTLRVTPRDPEGRLRKR